MAESNPKPTRLTDPAATPAATATPPSIAFHEMVAALSRRARRTASGRAGRDATSPTGTATWVRSAWSATAIEICVVRLDFQFEIDQISQRTGQPRRAQLVAHLAPLPLRADQTAPSQTGQVVRD